jgi:hypothetical protein
MMEPALEVVAPSRHLKRAARTLAAKITLRLEILTP